jgi:predicted transcriptional regulator of viral defense system
MTDDIFKFMRQRGVVRAREAVVAGFPRNRLASLARAGDILRLSRGVYTLPGLHLDQNFELAMVQKRIPHAVFCLISALSFHDLTTQIPHGFWIAIPRGSSRPTPWGPKLYISTLSPKAYGFGIEDYDIDGSTIRVYSPAKTVADCFKFRNQVGLDIAMEALKDAWRQRLATVDELAAAARINRVERVMRPYVETVVHSC